MNNLSVASATQNVSMACTEAQEQLDSWELKLFQSGEDMKPFFERKVNKWTKHLSDRKQLLEEARKLAAELNNAEEKNT